MANPVIVSCPAGVWTLVASNVTAGQVKKLNSAPNKYLETYRMTGDAAPTTRTEGIPCFVDTLSETIAAAAGIDVYIMAIHNDGQVRVDV